MRTLLSLLALVAPTFASDHIDGPVTTKHRVADLTDLYVFPTPKKPGTLTVILDAYPLVGTTGHFTDKVNYTLYFRRAAIKGTGDRPFFETSDEVSLNCTFKTPDVTADHVVTCKGSNGIVAESKYEVAQEKQEGDDFRLYSGMRSDPFFFDANFAMKAANGTLLSPHRWVTYDIMKHINVLTIVMEIEPKKLWKENTPSMIAVAAETTAREEGAVRRLDRVGRPEITNVTMAARKGDPELRDQYNLDRPFQVAPGPKAAYKERIFRNIDLYDQTDKKKNWQDADREALAQLLVEDFLVVDTSKSCDGANFFDIEKSMLAHKAHTSCGGRRLTDDIMDVFYSLYIAGLNGDHVGDGIDKPSKDPLEAFPYLAEPDLSLLGRTKLAIAKKALGIKD